MPAATSNEEDHETDAQNDSSYEPGHYAWNRFEERLIQRRRY